MDLADYKRRHYDMDNLPPPEEREKRARELKALRNEVLENDVTRTAPAEIVDVLADLDAEIAWFEQPAPPDNVPRMRGSRSLIDGTVYEGGSGMTFRCAATGRELHALTRDEKTYLGAPLSIGRCLHAMLTGRRDELSEVESLAMSGSSQTEGGYILDPALSGTLIDLARANSVAFKAGAQTVPMETAEMTLTRIASDPTGHWRAETGQVTASQPSFERVTLKARTLAAIVPVSIELLEDSSNAASIIEQTIQRALGLALDQAVLVGDGAGAEPVGVTNHANVHSLTAVGTPTDWSYATAAVGDVVGANFNGDVNELSWVQHPAVAELLDGLQDTLHQPLQQPPWVSKLRRFYTTSMPVASAEYTDIIGHFPNILVGMRTSGINIRVLDSGTVTDGDSVSWNATDQLMKHIVAYLRADVALLQPTWFAVSSGITLT